MRTIVFCCWIFRVRGLLVLFRDKFFVFGSGFLFVFVLVFVWT